MRCKVSTVLVLLLLAAGAWQFGSGVWIHAKAQLAQYLIGQAWQQTLVRQAPVKPWPWADTWPVARLRWGDAIDQYVLAGVNGAALAFGPAMTTRPDGQDRLIAGHRDTHFAFLAHVEPGDRLTLTDMQGRKTVYQVNARRVIDSRQASLTARPAVPALLLVTCYPFDALRANGPLRYVVTALPVNRQELVDSRI